MKVVLEPEAREELAALDNQIQAEVTDRIENLKENPLPENSYVIHLLDGTEVQCLKLQEEDRNSQLNHRVTYDIRQDNIIRIYGIFDREPGYRQIKKETGDRR